MSLTHCPSCSSPVTVGGRFCSSCGSSLEVLSTEVTRDRTPSPSDSSRGRFATGDILAARYRIVERIGKGGMGEVYHADDLTLEHPVALKVLPERYATNQDWLKHFRREVRIARQIAHPNVCRVYDIGEAEGLVFFTMEYIDGEDLSSLLRRIGRLPPDKGIEIARQLASGLAAAHDRGILHRDLKPSNIMLDERGQARITDFGLATAAGAIEKDDVRSGTPGYMAPEQWAGKEVTEKSDLYSLGLVLYELFTGKRAFEGMTPQELAKRRRDTKPTSPSSVIKGLEPSVERVILKCLEPDPKGRPENALEVRAAFPGGDPLASAVAAGKTPAPALVAEAGEGGALRPAIAWACLGVVLVSLPLIIWMSSLARLNQIVPLPRSPAFLAADARGILESFGYTDLPRDTTYGFSRHTGYIDRLMSEERNAEWWDLLRRGEPSMVRFWYRESPTYLVPHRLTEFLPTAHDPPLTIPGMIAVELDPNGRLRRLEAVSGGLDKPIPVPPMVWDLVLQAAGFDRESLSATRPLWVPPIYADERVAFAGNFPDAPEIPVRIEAAAHNGRPVWLRVIEEPWTEPAETESPFSRPSDIAATNVAKLFHIGLNLVLLVVLVLFARRNLRLGRCDRKGAFRLALFVFAVQMARWLLGAHHVPERSEVDIVFGGLYRAGFAFGLVWLFYIAFEPYARRLWPQTMVSWIRLLNGRFRDARVGRDVLIACFFAALTRPWSLLFMLFVPGWLGDVPPRPDFPVHASEFLALQSVSASLSQLFAHAGNAVNTCLFIIIGFLLLRFLLRRTWAAVAVAVALTAVVWGPGWPYLGWLGQPTIWGLWFFLFFRYGWVTAVVYIFIVDLLNSFPLTVDFSAWYAHPTYLAITVVGAVTLYGFHVSLGGRAAFGDLLAED